MSEGPKKVKAADGHIYHKSATANATTAPTNAATIANALGLAGLDKEQAEFVTCVDYEWNMHRGIDKDSFCEEYGYDREEFEKLVTAPVVLGKLQERGIPPHLVNPDALTEKAAKRVKLTPLQLKAANVMMDLVDSRSTKKKLQDIGVTSAQYNGWLKDSNFQDYLKQLSENLLGDISHEAALALADRVMAGDLKAIEYYNEMRGYYVRASASNSGGTAVDWQQMIVRIIEIIVDEVSNPAEAQRIAGKLKGLVMGQQVAGIMPTEEIVQPVIAKPREVTPDIKELMSKGVGYNS